MQLTVYW